jgi:uncharacterized membrane protein
VDNEKTEPVWHYRGYDLRSSEFTTAMVHLYRAEITRCNTWRTRLDATTNWAVITTGAAISFALSNPANHYGVIVLNMLLITLFLWIEARRYRYYELWSLRTRLLETDFFAAMLVPPFAPHADWAETLAYSLLQPEFPVSMLEAFGRRLRRNYLWIFVILACAWGLKGYLHPIPAVSWVEFVSRSAIGTFPGEFILSLGALYFVFLGAIALLTIRMTQATGEVLPKFGADKISPGISLDGQSVTFPRLHGLKRRQQLLTWIVTDKPAEVAEKILGEMHRGVTKFSGQGMYTGQERPTLMVALTVTEVAELKMIVRNEDPGAFVIVTPAQEVLGKGFQERT